jgi:hypothetical protein
MVPEMRQVEAVEQEIRGLQLRVVAHHAIAIDERALGGPVRRMCG